MALLEIKDLHTSFQTEDGVVRAVDGVNFSVEKGQTLGIVGESGCGKSVTCLTIMGLNARANTITSGEAAWKGKDLLKMNSRQLRSIRGDEIAMIFQDPMTSLNPVNTIGKQLVEAIQLHRDVTKRVARARALELLKAVGIPRAETRIDDYPHQFSGGMRQRVMIAMALVNDPDLLVADEPTTALDVTTQAQILTLMKRLQEDFGSAIMIITHDLGVVAEIADDVLVMYAATVVEQAHDAARHRRLAAAGLADDADGLALLHGEADAVDRLHRGDLLLEDDPAGDREMLLDVVDDEEVVARHPRRGRVRVRHEPASAIVASRSLAASRSFVSSSRWQA